MQEIGLTPEEMETRAQAHLILDRSFDDGTIISSMCSQPGKPATDWFSRTLEKNLGDPGLIPGTADIEQEVIALAGNLLGEPEAAGHIVSGGTEANLLAIWTAKILSGSEKDELIVPDSAHFSFDKAADLMGLRLIRIPLDEKHRVLPSLVEAAISPRTLALVGIAGTTGLGAVDPLERLSAIALKHRLYFHVDAAFGGFVLPFLSKPPAFDFRLPGVSSITLDPHKMGRSVIPGGIILYRNQETASVIRTKAPYLSGGGIYQGTITGTRPGASAWAAWATMNSLGRSGYRRIVAEAMKKTAFLCRSIGKTDYCRTMIAPTMNVVGIASHSLEASALASRLRKKNWAVSLFKNYIRIVLMPHVDYPMLERFLCDLEFVHKEYTE